MKDELESFSFALSETGTWVQVATQQTRATVTETFLTKQILKTLTPCTGARQWLTVTVENIIYKERLQDPLYLSDFLKPITLQIPHDAIIRELISRGFVPMKMPSITQVFLQSFWALPAGF